MFQRDFVGLLTDMKSVKNQVSLKYQVLNQDLSNQVSNQVLVQVWNQVLDQVWNQVSDQVWSKVHDEIS
jgi:hypothetical protein